MPSTPIEENRPQILVPQWRFRNRFTRGVGAPVVNTWYELTGARQSDATAYYFTVVHLAGANRDIEARIVFDGVTYDGAQAAAVSGTLYYMYIDGNAVALTSTVNRTLIAGDTTMPAHGVQFWFRTTDAAGAPNLSAVVRMVTL